MMDISVDNRVRELRKAGRISQQQLAWLTGVSRQAIIAIEKRRITPSMKTGLLIARALKCSLADLFWIKTSGKE